MDAAPEVVFDVVSNPEQIADWWLTETDVEPSRVFYLPRLQKLAESGPR